MFQNYVRTMFFCQRVNIEKLKFAHVKTMKQNMVLTWSLDFQNYVRTMFLFQQVNIEKLMFAHVKTMKPKHGSTMVFGRLRELCFFKVHCRNFLWRRNARVTLVMTRTAFGATILQGSAAFSECRMIEHQTRNNHGLSMVSLRAIFKVRKFYS